MNVNIPVIPSVPSAWNLKPPNTCSFVWAGILQQGFSDVQRSLSPRSHSTLSFGLSPSLFLSPSSPPTRRHPLLPLSFSYTYTLPFLFTHCYILLSPFFFPCSLYQIRRSTSLLLSFSSLHSLPLPFISCIFIDTSLFFVNVFLWPPPIIFNNILSSTRGGFHLHYKSTSNYIPNLGYYIKLSDVKPLTKFSVVIFASKLQGFALTRPQEH